MSRLTAPRRRTKPCRRGTIGPATGGEGRGETRAVSTDRAARRRCIHRIPTAPVPQPAHPLSSLRDPARGGRRAHPRGLPRRPRGDRHQLPPRRGQGHSRGCRRRRGGGGHPGALRPPPDRGAGRQSTVHVHRARPQPGPQPGSRRQRHQLRPHREPAQRQRPGRRPSERGTSRTSAISSASAKA